MLQAWLSRARPLTNLVTKKKVSDALAKGTLCAGHFSFHGQGYKIVLYEKTCLPSGSAQVTGQVPKRIKEACVTPFWCVRSSTNEAECNMEMTVHEVQVVVSDKGKRLPAGKRALEVPCLQNTKKVEAGQELVVLEGKRTKRA